MSHGAGAANVPETALVESARRGSGDALEALVRMHEARVFAVLRRSVPPGEVEDLAQEAFLRAFRDLPRYRGDAPFGAWLLRIVRNLVVDRHRRAGRRGAPIGLAAETGLEDDAAPPDPSPGPAERLERRRLEARLDAALGRLGETDRLAVLLHDQEGLSAEDVARVIGGNAGSVRVRLFRARRKLRAWLQEAG